LIESLGWSIYSTGILKCYSGLVFLGFFWYTWSFSLSSGVKVRRQIKL